MSNIVSGVIVPHPPIILPKIGRGDQKAIEDIDQAYREAAEVIAKSQPDTVVIITPHGPAYYDYIQLSSGQGASGNLGQFGDYEDSFKIAYDEDLVKEIEKICTNEGIPCGTLGVQRGDLDHGTMIPLYYLQNLLKNTKFVRVSVGGPGNKEHYAAGRAIAKAAKKLNKKVAVVGSGDLSHCQKAGTHYGFKECGPAYDAKIMDIMSKGDFDRLLDISEEEADEAMVCGQKPFCVLAGTMDGLKPEAKGLAHSAEFGVGYGVCTYQNPKEEDGRDFLIQAGQKAHEAYLKKIEREDPYVRLARQVIESTINGQEDFVPDFKIPQELLEERAGCFVSLHKNGKLRGCIGTTGPTQKNLFHEIYNNAISASTKDPRFPAVQPWELEDLDINVDVLKQPQPIDSPDELDVKKYGVIVSKKGRRGLLLPDLEGVDTIEQQLRIAKQKAGLDPDEKGCTLQRFEVVRHE